MAGRTAQTKGSRSLTFDLTLSVTIMTSSNQHAYQALLKLSGSHLDTAQDKNTASIDLFGVHCFSTFLDAVDDVLAVLSCRMPLNDVEWCWWATKRRIGIYLLIGFYLLTQNILPSISLPFSLLHGVLLACCCLFCWMMDVFAWWVFKGWLSLYPNYILMSSLKTKETYLLLGALSLYMAKRSILWTCLIGTFFPKSRTRPPKKASFSLISLLSLETKNNTHHVMMMDQKEGCALMCWWSCLWWPKREFLFGCLLIT